jgi:hypothetical protein
MPRDGRRRAALGKLLAARRTVVAAAAAERQVQDLVERAPELLHAQLRGKTPPRLLVTAGRRPSSPASQQGRLMRKDFASRARAGFL